MRTSGATQRRSYVYAIQSGGSETTYGIRGVLDLPVRAMPIGHVRAVVSEMAVEDLKPAPAHVLAHLKVLRDLMERETVLPVSFGVIVRGGEFLTNLIAPHSASLSGQLRDVRGKVEMSVRVAWTAPNLIEYLAKRYPGLRGSAASAGMEYDRALREERDGHARQVERLLAPCCYTVQRLAVRDDHEVLSLACLIGRGDQSDFESALSTTAGLFDAGFEFNYSGPWAPHSFVHFDLGCEPRPATLQVAPRYVPVSWSPNTTKN